MNERNPSSNHNEPREQGEIMRQINRDVASGGISREELSSIEEVEVAPGWRVKDLIHESLRLGTIQWEKDKIVPRKKS